METHIYYIYEVQGHKVGATKDWSNRRQYNFDRYGIEPVIIETIEGPNNEETWKIVGDREWELADEKGYERGGHYLVMMRRTLAAHTEEANSKRNTALKGKEGYWKGKPKSAEHRAKMAEAKKGKPKSAETRAKQSVAMKGKPQEQATCPHCAKTGAGNVMKRWHFDNCKHKNYLRPL